MGSIPREHMYWIKASAKCVNVNIFEYFHVDIKLLDIVKTNRGIFVGMSTP